MGLTELVTAAYLALFSLVLQQQKFMASENFVQPAIPRFDGHYDHWSMLMENFLRSKEYWELVETGCVKPASG